MRRIGNDHGDRLADVAHFVLGQHGLAERLELRKWLKTERDKGHRGAEVMRRDDRAHAGHGQGDRRVDGADTAMGDGTAQDDGVELALEIDIADEPPAATQKAKVLDPLDGAADQQVSRGHDEVSSSA